MLKSSFKPRNPKDFKILIFYPNLHMSALMPQSVGIFTALLRREGYQLDLFDCTYYQDIDSLSEAVMRKGDHHIDQPCMACFDKKYITNDMNVEKINELEDMRIKDRNGK